MLLELLLSVDLSARWHASLEGALVGDVAAAAGRGRRVFAAMHLDGASIQRSEDGGSTWERIDAPSDDFAIEAWVIKPPHFDPDGTYPVILDVHGGPHGAYGYGFNVSAQVMAAAGYIVILANPRGSTTYGRAFTDAVLGDWGEGPWRDLQAVLDAVLSHPWADETRTGVFGYSYGGFAAVAASVRSPSPFQCAIAGAPVADLGRLGTSWSDNRIQRIIQGKTVTVLIDGKKVVEYDEPEGVLAGKDFERKLGAGTFALQAHDPKSIVHYRNIRVKRLAD